MTENGVGWTTDPTAVNMSCSINDPFHPPSILSLGKKGTDKTTSLNETNVSIIESWYDGDVFECEAISEASKAVNFTVKTSIALHLAYGPDSSPSIEVSPDDIQVGSALTLKCAGNFSMNPYPPVAEWYFDGKEIDRDMTIGKSKYTLLGYLGFLEYRYYLGRLGLSSPSWKGDRGRRFSHSLGIRAFNYEEHEGKTVECRVKNPFTHAWTNASVVLSKGDGPLTASMAVVLGCLVFASFFAGCSL